MVNLMVDFLLDRKTQAVAEPAGGGPEPTEDDDDDDDNDGSS